MQDIYSYLRYTANLIANSKFGNKFILKGGSVLRAKLIECGRDDLSRVTRDLDIHCDSRDVWIDFYTNIESILNMNDAGLVYRLIKRRSETKGLMESDSLHFEIRNGKEAVYFKIDMNIKSNNIITVDYSPVPNMRVYDAYTMLSDKIVVVSSQSIFRRIKDLYDIAVLISIYDFRYFDVLEHLTVKHPNANLNNMLVPYNYDYIRHAYNSFEGILNKPNVEYLISFVLCFLEPIYMGYNKGELVWNAQRSCWVQL